MAKVPQTPPVKPEQAGKGRPTPKRRDSEAANRRPLMSGNRKADRARARAAADEQRALMNRAMETGEERHLPMQHRGPGKRWARAYVDSRWTIGEFFLPLALLVVLVMFMGDAIGMPPEAVVFAILALYGVLLVVILEAALLARTVRKRVRAKYGQDAVRGVGFYTAMRAMQLRRMRLPKPQVERGQKPS